MTEPIDEPTPQGQHNKDRMRRADAWIKRSELEDTEDIERFMFLWIAFNAAYSNEDSLRDFVNVYGRKSESHRFEEFLRNIVEQDKSRVLEGIVWKRFSGPIRVLLDNPYVFQPFWDAIREAGERDDDWKRRLNSEKRKAQNALKRGDVHTTLSVVFRRLYTLRNQIFHGYATHPSGFGQDQIRDGSRIMAALVPAIINIMQQEINRDLNSEIWGKVAYPRINAEPE